MSKKKIEDIVAGLAEPITSELNYELVDVEYIKEAGNWYLRVYIDKPGGIFIEDCQSVSERLSEKLDETDPIAGSYILEVSSPGLTRPMKKDKDFIRNSGREVEISLFAELNGKKEYYGVLKGLDENSNVLLQISDKETLTIPKQSISNAKLKLDF